MVLNPVFPFEFPRLQTIFLTFFGEKEIGLFSAKIPYNSNHQFWKSWLKKITFFKNDFRRLRSSNGWYYRIFSRKIGRYPIAWYLFCVWCICFFTRKSLVAKIGLKKITFKVKDITFSFDFRAQLSSYCSKSYVILGY